MTETNADWWHRHQATPPTLLLVCGIERCQKVIGEVKVADGTEIALMHNRFGDRVVPYTRRITEESLGFPPGTVLRDATTGETLSEMQDRKFNELDAETLRYTEGDRRVAKRYTAGPRVTILDAIGHIVCPTHGVVDLPDSDAAIADLRSVLADTKHASKRRYVMFRGT